MKRPPLILTACAVVAAAGCSAVTGTQPAARPSLPPMSAPSPAARYAGFSVPGFPPDPGRLAALEAAAGVRATAVSLYIGLGSPLDTAAVSSLQSSGALPVIEIDSDKVPLAKVADGAGDGALAGYARQVAALRRPVAIDFDHEFNGPWFSWGFRHETAAVFVAAWRRVVSVFRAAGASNVAWIWDPNRGSSVTTALRPWWPGGAWVTWVGIDGYYFTPQATFATVFTPTLAQVRAFTRKPVFIVETGIIASPSRASQITGLFAGARKAGVIGVIWFDYSKRSATGAPHDWRIDGAPASLAAFRAGAREFG
jgi:mannan endo-1,4-beta-mannosidase